MIKKFLLKYNYPQIVFGKQIVNYIRASGKPHSVIIDCPCGNGETSWHLSRLGKVIAADISEKSIENARRNFSNPDISFSQRTIEAVLAEEKKFDVFCLINSLFLLDNYDQILRSLQLQITANKAMLILVIPNTKGRNFTWFQSKDDQTNKLLIEEPKIRSFFETYGFNVQYIQPICYAHHYGRKDAKLFSVFWSLYLIFLNRIQSMLKYGKPNYFLIALSSEKA
jgi:2-polyprenyl-3-methyl-5-hydroxy-6-metoxy-1,4-benzoquinol methylase